MFSSSVMLYVVCYRKIMQPCEVILDCLQNFGTRASISSRGILKEMKYKPLLKNMVPDNLKGKGMTQPINAISHFPSRIFFERTVLTFV